MFSGIVRELGRVNNITLELSIVNLFIEISESILDKICTGDSIAVNGICLTVVRIMNGVVLFNVIEETMLRTTLKYLKQNDLVNIEPALTFGDYIGGHLVSGHVIGNGKIVNILKNEYYVEVAPSIIKFIFEKGFIAINGVSLTVVSVDYESNIFSTHLIPETIVRTNLGMSIKYNNVNIEIDALTQAAVISAERAVENMILKNGL